MPHPDRSSNISVRTSDGSSYIWKLMLTVTILVRVVKPELAMPVHGARGQSRETK